MVRMQDGIAKSFPPSLVKSIIAGSVSIILRVTHKHAKTKNKEKKKKRRKKREEKTRRKNNNNPATTQTKATTTTIMNHVKKPFDAMKLTQGNTVLYSCHYFVHSTTPTTTTTTTTTILLLLFTLIIISLSIAPVVFSAFNSCLYVTSRFCPTGRLQAHTI